MRRLLVVVCVGAFLAALPLSHVVMAAPADKVAICHVNSANDAIDLGYGYSVIFGRVIEVDESAVEQHIAQHGDSLEFWPFDKEFRDWVEEVYEVSLPNADCYFVVSTEPMP